MSATQLCDMGLSAVWVTKHRAVDVPSKLHLLQPFCSQKIEKKILQLQLPKNRPALFS